MVTEYPGLLDRQVEESLRLYGDNRLPQRKRVPFAARVLENLRDPIIRILIVALAVNILVNLGSINWAENIGIVLSILISSIVSAASEYGSERAFDKLQASGNERKVVVIRNRERRLCDVDSLVRGDLIELTSGMTVPCDGYLVSGSLRVNQAALNGESREEEKHPSPRPKELCPDDAGCLFRGTAVCGGSGRMISEKVGKETLYGQIVQDIQAGTRESPMKLRLQKLAKTISGIGYAAAAIIACTYLFSHFVIDCRFDMGLILWKLSDWRGVLKALLHAITVAVTVIVVAVPEGLPMMITVVLSSNMKRMLRAGVLVRKLVGIETAGSMDLLFTDKTGTITTGELACVGYLNEIGESRAKSDEIRCAMSLGNPCEKVDGRWIGGNATDRALAVANEGSDGALVPDRITAFDSDRKYSGAGIGNVSYYRGAPDILLAKCEYLENGEKYTDEKKALLRSQMTTLSQNKARLLLLAKAFGVYQDDSLPDQLIFLGVVILRDPIRKTAKSAVSTLHHAGIGVVMITGDSPETALAVADECGILFKERDQVLTSAALRGMSDYELKAILPHLAVVARALPGDKTRLVQIAQEMGSVVGMTGDGINDAPALKSADVGFAMGGGSEVAKEAGDIVLLKEDLTAISDATLFGRTIFHSIRKFILFQLTMNLLAVCVSFIGQLLGIDNPITVVQMLWVNLIMDTLGALAFAGEPTQTDYMRETPKKREERILTGSMIARVLTVGLFSTAVCSWFLCSEKMRAFYGYYSDPVYFLTAFFAIFIFSGIVICFLSRTENGRLLFGLWKNRAFLLIMSGILVIQILMLRFGGDVFRCAVLSMREYLPVILLPLLLLPFDKLRYWLFKKPEFRKRRAKIAVTT